MVQINSSIDESIFDLGTILSIEKVCDICKICKKPHIESKKAVVVNPETRVLEVLQIMKENGTDYVLIRDKKERAIGIFTTTDMIKFLANKNIDQESALVKDFMVEPVTMNCEQSISDAMKIMYRGKIKHVPIVRSETGKIRSVITVEDVINYISDFFPNSLFNISPENVDRYKTVEGA